jgi:hypothetical protein
LIQKTRVERKERRKKPLLQLDRQIQPSGQESLNPQIRCHILQAQAGRLMRLSGCSSYGKITLAELRVPQTSILILRNGTDSLFLQLEKKSAHH